jgi:hypothetical protein
VIEADTPESILANMVMIQAEGGGKIHLDINARGLGVSLRWNRGRRMTLVGRKPPS